MILEVSNIHKSYQQAHQNLVILKGVELQLDESESMAILGRSGSGKSTLLSLLAGLDKADEGEIKFLGEKLGDKTESQLTSLRAKNIGIVFQQFNLMSTLTAFENISLPLEISGQENIEERVHKILADVGLSERANHYPHQLSGGENQRVAIARAIVGSPKLVLADEPSGNLDVETGKKTMDLLFDLVEKNKLCLILVTHDEHLAKRCHKVVKLVNGAIT